MIGLQQDLAPFIACQQVISSHWHFSAVLLLVEKFNALFLLAETEWNPHATGLNKETLHAFFSLDRMQSYAMLSLAMLPLAVLSFAVLSLALRASCGIAPLAVLPFAVLS